MDSYIIFGAGGHCNSIASAIIAQGDRISAIIDPYSSARSMHGAPIFKKIEEVDLVPGARFAIAIGDNAKRASLASTLLEANSIDRFKPVIHPSAVVELNASIGAGSVILAGVILGCNAVVEQFCIVNNNAVADHDTKLAAFASLGPGALLGGRVEVGQYSAIGIGAVVIEQTHIGAEAIIGANSTVLDNVENNAVMVGSPARTIKTRQHGDRYLK